MKLSIALQGNKSPAEYAALAELVEGLGFAVISLYEDLMFQPAWTPLHRIARHTRRIELGPAVVNPYLRHPAIIAGEIALLNEAAAGRAYLGLGRGAFLEQLDLTQPRPISAVRDAIEIVRRLLRGDRTPYSGRVFSIGRDVAFQWRPAQETVPILVGTWGPRMAQMAGALADAVKVGGCWNPDFIPLIRSHIERGAVTAGRNPAEVELVVGAVTVISEDRREAELLARREVAMYLPAVIDLDPTLKVDPEEVNGVKEAVIEGDLEMAAARLSSATLSKLACFGTPDDIIEQTAVFEQAGVSRVEYGTPHGPDEPAAIRLLGERVLPYFNGQ